MSQCVKNSKPKGIPDATRECDATTDEALLLDLRTHTFLPFLGAAGCPNSVRQKKARTGHRAHAAFPPSPTALYTKTSLAKYAASTM